MISPSTKRASSSYRVRHPLHWEHLPAIEQTEEIRYHLVVLDAPARSAHVAVAFVARQLRPDQIVVAYPTLVRHPGG
ncbi:MAG: hypothetical protein OEY41_09600 [Acidimicrobiia bacterium]|nr:hypothetical protein [Acidimicrobiia bacterium]